MAPELGAETGLGGIAARTASHNTGLRNNLSIIP
jgi:hypothetical protein